MQVRCLGGEHVDAFVQVTVAGGDRDAGVGGFSDGGLLAVSAVLGEEGVHGAADVGPAEIGERAEPVATRPGVPESVDGPVFLHHGAGGIGPSANAVGMATGYGFAEAVIPRGPAEIRGEAACGGEAVGLQPLPHNLVSVDGIDARIC